MQVAVIGAGIVGVTTAYELACRGHEVTVFERRGSVAAEGGFADSGLLSASGLPLWPSVPSAAELLMQWFKTPKHLALRHVPLRPSALAWWRDARRALNRDDTRLALARLSAERRLALIRRHEIDHESAEGHLVLLPSTSSRAGNSGKFQPEALTERLRRLSIPVRLLDADGCLALEPGLDAGRRSLSGISLPSDAVSNCRQFAHLLKNAAQSLGVSFLFHHEVLRIAAGKRPSVAYRLLDAGETRLAGTERESRKHRAQDEQSRSVDAVVVCAAAGSAVLLRPLGIRLPLAAVEGHSITAPMRDPGEHGDPGPRSAVTDLQRRVTITRLGQRVRVVGGQDWSRGANRLSADVIGTLHRTLDRWFPGAARWSQAQRWKGTQALSPDGLPWVGASTADGVWLNLGHGGQGWSWACGTAVLLAGAVSGQPPMAGFEALSPKLGRD